MTTKKDKDLTEVVIRHGAFRYHEAGVDPYLPDDKGNLGRPIVMIKHAERGQTIFVNPTDYARGMNGGAFFPAGTIVGQGAEPDSIGVTGEPKADEQEDFDFVTASDEEIDEYLQRHTPEDVLAKVSGEDLQVLEHVLSVEYARTDGHPNQMLKDQFVDLLGENPEEDEDGNWVNEPDPEDKTEPQKQQASARKGKGRAATARSGGRNS